MMISEFFNINYVLRDFEILRKNLFYNQGRPQNSSNCLLLLFFPHHQIFLFMLQISVLNMFIFIHQTSSYLFETFLMKFRNGHLIYPHFIHLFEICFLLFLLHFYLFQISNSFCYFY